MFLNIFKYLLLNFLFQGLNLEQQAENKTLVVFEKKNSYKHPKNKQAFKDSVKQT